MCVCDGGAHQVTVSGVGDKEALVMEQEVVRDSGVSETTEVVTGRQAVCMEYQEKECIGVEGSGK